MRSSYLSTSQTARMLGLSTGTVQRMVASGALQAYTTQGGHRRILASSIDRYCRSRGVPVPHAQPAVTGACVIHHTSMAAPLRQTLQAMPRVQLVSHPLELAGLAEEEPVFFVDARVGWLDWADIHRPQGLAPAGRLIVYNSTLLSPEQQQSLSGHARLYPGDLSHDLMAGFLLSAADPDIPAPGPMARH